MAKWFSGSGTLFHGCVCFFVGGELQAYLMTSQAASTSINQQEAKAGLFRHFSSHTKRSKTRLLHAAAAAASARRGSESTRRHPSFYPTLNLKTKPTRTPPPQLSSRSRDSRVPQREAGPPAAPSPVRWEGAERKALGHRSLAPNSALGAFGN